MKFHDLHFGFRCFTENSVSLCSLEKLLHSLYPLITHIDCDNWSGCKIDSVVSMSVSSICEVMRKKYWKLGKQKVY